MFARTALAFICVISAHVQAQAQTVLGRPTSYPVVIDQPGHYKLGAGFNAPAQTAAIKITAANVVLDLNGFTVKGPGFCGSYCQAPGQTSGIVISAFNVTVRNGAVSGFDFAGVSFPNQQVQLEDLTLNDNNHSGVYRSGLPANPNGETMPATLRRVSAVRNGAYGVYGYGMTIENSSLSQNFGAGMWSQGGNAIFDTTLQFNRNFAYAHVIGDVPPSDYMRASVIRASSGSNVTPQFLPRSLGNNVVAGSQVF
jgi:hypothetical protein